MSLRDSLRQLGWTDELIDSFLEVEALEGVVDTVSEPLFTAEVSTTELVVSRTEPEMTSGANS
jgi:hypothetical protein